MRFNQKRLICVLILAFLCPSVALLPAAQSEESAGDLLGRMYWTHDRDGIYRAARDGSEIELIVRGTGINSIAVDPAGGNLYWCAVTDRAKRLAQVCSAKIDGSSRRILAESIHWAGDIVVDVEGGHLYVASLGDGKIVRVRLDGKRTDDFLTDIAPPRQLLVDKTHHKLYWSSNSVNRLDRIGLNGAGREAVLTKMPSVAFGFALSPDEQAIYWADPAGRIFRSKLDGSEHKALITARNHPDGLSIDLENRKLYWAENGAICQANLDGGEIEKLVTDKTTQYSSLEVFPPAEE